MDHIENTLVSIVAVQLLQLPSNGLRNTVSNSISIVVEACLSLCCIATAVVSLFISRYFPSKGSMRQNTIEFLYLTMTVSNFSSLLNIFEVSYVVSYPLVSSRLVSSRLPSRFSIFSQLSSPILLSLLNSPLHFLSNFLLTFLNSLL
jgi:hypothetical protein